MYSFESKGARGGLHAMVIAAFTVAAILFGLSTYDGIPFPVIFQTAAVICLVAAVYLTARYSLRLYRYAIESNGITDARGCEVCDLVITEITGRRIKIVARVSLRDVGEVAVVRRTDKAARETVKAGICKERQVFRYANTPVMPEECYILLPHEDAVMVIPADPHMIAILTSGQ